MLYIKKTFPDKVAATFQEYKERRLNLHITGELEGGEIWRYVGAGCIVCSIGVGGRGEV